MFLTKIWIYILNLFCKNQSSSNYFDNQLINQSFFQKHFRLMWSESKYLLVLVTQSDEVRETFKKLKWINKKNNGWLQPQSNQEKGNSKWLSSLAPPKEIRVNVINGTSMKHEGLHGWWVLLCTEERCGIKTGLSYSLNAQNYISTVWTC